LIRGIGQWRADPLLAVRLSDLAHELCPGHVDGPINGARVRPRVVLQDLIFLLDKAIYEVLYELNSRPAWVRIALMGITWLVP